jgi:sulfate/thiosulfate transport system permease protein
MARVVARQSVLPGFSLTMGFTVFYLSLIVLIPLGAAFLKAFTMSWPQFWETVTAARALASYRLSLGAALVAATINSVLGLLAAWVLVRYEFPGKRMLDALIDLPFALPTAVAGITLTAIFAGNGWLGSWLEPLGIKVAFTWLGVVVALTFIGLPFVVRTVQPVLQELDPEAEEAAAVLGASRWQSLSRVIFPELLPALLTGFALAFARAVGEYGSVVFISGNMPMKTEITPLLIVTKLSQYDYAGATALAVATLAMSFSLLFVINLLQWWSRSRYA